MTASISQFLSDVKKLYGTGEAREGSYRVALGKLFESLPREAGIKAINEPKHTEVGAPDFIIQQDNLTIGYVEAKDITSDLNKADKDQKKRYLSAFGNLIYTNCLVWQFYHDGEMRKEVEIATLASGKLTTKPSAYGDLAEWYDNFLKAPPQKISSPKDLAERMAGKARLIKEILLEVLDRDKKQTTSIGLQHKAFQDHLIDNLPKDTFAEIYAETIVYGMFSARLHYNGNPAKFTRSLAYESMPRTNPFLRHLFKELGSDDFDHNLKWIVDDLAKVFASCDLYAIMHSKSKKEESDDPFMHFYETFLATYNPAKRKSHGVWYTPKPVVDFIVRAVDEVLKTEFKIAEGIASNQRIDWLVEDEDGTKTTKKVHRVQILDPATGTGTFLAEACKHIIGWVKKSTPSTVSDYISNHLIPRLHGFEVMMAPYAMCHNKLDITLANLGYQPPKNGRQNRLSIFLTDTLEERKSSKQGEMAFAQWLLREAEGAREIKRDTPIMCVIGNPPYLSFSKNQNPWIDSLVANYRRVLPKGAPKNYTGDGVDLTSHEADFKERNPKILQDDYIKFMRVAEFFINRTGEGVLGFITNHAYLDNVTCRGMRWHLLKTFDKIYVIDLHGNARRGETTEDGHPDKNVFDIQQGVAITIAIKTAQKSSEDTLAKVYHRDIRAKTRAEKFETLAKSTLGKQNEEITPLAPNFFFVKKDYGLLAEYDKGFLLTDFMPEYKTGLKSSRDKLVVAHDEGRLIEKINRFADPSKSDDEVREEFFSNQRADRFARGDTAKWNLAKARQRLQNDEGENWKKDICKIDYRPFDEQVILYADNMVDRRRYEAMRHMLKEDNGRKVKSGNIGLVVSRQTSVGDDWRHVFISNSIIEHCHISNKGKECGYIFPLYLAKGSLKLDMDDKDNFDPALKAQLIKLATHPKHGKPKVLAIFDYIYGVLHCPSYRQKYSEWLKVDFPRIPWPKSPDMFWRVSQQGTELRKLHLMQSATMESLDIPYKLLGKKNLTVEKPRYNANTKRIYINDDEYFADVPELAWEMHIGGYQPAQAWLKSRKGMRLDHDTVQHYRHILAVLVKTHDIMQSITLD
ncbi:MAG: N-6 DNA methylase [Proteobacteria bacterium]|nr:N-6 DNA methylase [Pseudomonadota bacterium]